jgi:zinc resistance-associated protein
MWKSSAAGLLMLAITGLSPVLAQQAPPSTPVNQQPAATATAAPRWSAEDGAAFTEARIAALKAGLTLKPDQEKAWAAFEKAFRDLARQQSDRAAQARGEPAPSDPIMLLRRRADAMSASANALRQLVDAAEPLYRSLDDGQKRRMVALVASDRR